MTDGTSNIAVSIVTIDRRPHTNYLYETLANLRRGGLIGSKRVLGHRIFDSGRSNLWSTVMAQQALRDGEHPDTDFVISGRCANLNVAAALAWGADQSRHGAQWVLFLEDDIDVCADFFDSVGAWLDDYATDDRHVYAFGANYPHVQECADRGIWCWDYPIKDYYGTQAFAVSTDDAADLAAFIESDPYRIEDDGTEWDLIMHEWAYQRWPEIRHFLASCPSFVQHIGRESIVNPRKHVHTFPSWPGREWSYLEHRPGVLEGTTAAGAQL